ncbi:phosphoribosylglycinamide formyltransferase [Novibacillus thermophilus]|uniref:Phosphoribosylglycinamide formyltransferase n=1 Tax=Novibacillus thermophilus TaxID=1471761 RepID=A0A1U9K3W4_9BACL|nr:phosphoribosylglycinamide formyltransferase [Novibacillus thermophilus]AQS54714.1 phosphoribosylglycinamide formyltransferase [Novibacillus thermophilus]
MTIAVFASGSGTNFERLVQVSREERWLVPIVVLICDQPGAHVLKRADRLGVPSYVFSPKAFETKAAYEQAVYDVLRRHDVTWIVLAGYMRLVGPTLLDAYPNRIVNIHPSLLPAFPGKNAVGQALAHGVKVTGVTVHFVDEGMDTGSIIAQRAVDVSETEDEHSLTAKIQAVEHELYPHIVRQLTEEETTKSDIVERAVT